MGDAITASPAVGGDGTIYIATMGRFLPSTPCSSVKWSTNIANGDWSWLAPSASVAPDNSAVYIASQAGSVLAFNPTNGVLVWSNYLGGMIYGSPAVSAADGTVCIGNALGSPEGTFGLNPATGATNWCLPLVDPSGNDSYYGLSPAIGSDCTTFVTGGLFDLYAVHPNGSLAWFFPFSAYASPQSSPAIDSSGDILLGSANGYVYCLNPAGGLK